MQIKKLALTGTAVTALALAGGVTVPAQAAHTHHNEAADAATSTISVPSDFVAALSGTGATGHYEVVGTGLRIWTEGTGSTDKVAEYVATETPLSGVGEPALDYAPTAGTTQPGFQLIVDFDADGSADGILVGEPTFYGNDWWLSNGSADFVKAAAPSHEGGSGSENHGTLDQWRAAFPDATVQAFGFSLGSGVLGDGVISAMHFADATYTFSADVVLTGKQECKKGGWKASTAPVFKNQGDCVSFFASAK